jgi:cell division protein ZapA
VFVVKSPAVGETPNSIPVEIFGQTYSVKAGTDPGYVRELAAFVDGKMREASVGAGAVDSVRIAVLAALNIADECFRARATAHEAADKAQARAAVLARALASALE